MRLDRTHILVIRHLELLRVEFPRLRRVRQYNLPQVFYELDRSLPPALDTTCQAIRVDSCLHAVPGHKS